MFSLRSVLQKDKLNGTNFIDWSRNLRIVLKQEKKLEVLEHPLPNKPAGNSTNAQREAFDKRKNDSNDVTCLMLAAFEIMTHLKEMFKEQARHERFVTTKALTVSVSPSPNTLYPEFYI